VKNNLKFVDYLLTDEMDAPLYRCVIAQQLAATTFQAGGVYGLGAKRLHVLIDEQKPIDATALVVIVIAAKKGRVTETELHVVVDILMHESFNTRRSSQSQQLSGHQ
jgi:hypothetical protein